MVQKSGLHQLRLVLYPIIYQGFVHPTIDSLGGGFKHFLFSPLLGEHFQFWREYFSNGLVQRSLYGDFQ